MLLCARVQVSKEQAAEASSLAEQEAPKRRGWFGFGGSSVAEDPKKSVVMEFSEKDLQKMHEVFSMDKEKSQGRVPGLRELQSKLEVGVENHYKLL